MGASLTIEVPRGSVEAGGELTVRLHVTNTGKVVDELTLAVVGRSSSWAEITPPTVNLFPGASGDATIRFTPPRNSSVPAGNVPYAVRVTSSEDPQGGAIEEGTIEVLPFSSIRAEIVPQTSYGRTEGRHELHLVNEGNAPEDLAIVASDPDQLLSLAVAPPNLRLAEGASGTVEIRVSPANDVAREPGTSRRFTVRIADHGRRDVATLPAGFQLVRRRRRWWPAMAVALVFAIAGLALAVPRILPGLQVTPPPEQGTGPTPTIATPNASEEGGEVTDEPSDEVVTSPPTEPPVTEPPVTEPPEPLDFLERVAGSWTLESWTEAGGPITLNIEILNGTMKVNGPDEAESGLASWRMDIQERGEPTSPQPAILCGGQTTLSGTIEGVPGGGRNGEFDWTSDLHSVDHSSTGEGWIWRAMCGWAVIGTRAPFAVTPDGDASLPASRMEMTNEYGTFRWSRS